MRGWNLEHDDFISLVVFVFKRVAGSLAKQMLFRC